VKSSIPIWSFTVFRSTAAIAVTPLSPIAIPTVREAVPHKIQEYSPKVLTEKTVNDEIGG
jgi:hypothetical protein